jgi:hypothetical protein
MKIDWPENAIRRGLEELKLKRLDVVFEISQGLCCAVSKNEAARDLRDAIDRSIGPCVTGLGYVLENIFARACTEFGASMIFQDKDGNKLSGTPEYRRPGRQRIDIVLKF